MAALWILRGPWYLATLQRLASHDGGEFQHMTGAVISSQESFERALEKFKKKREIR